MSKEYSEVVNQRKTDNTMTKKRKRTEEPTMIYKTLHRKSKIGQKRRWHSYALKRLVVHAVCYTRHILRVILATNKRQRIPKRQSKMDNREETGNIGYTRHRTKRNKKEQKNTPLYAYTNNVNKTRVLLQTDKCLSQSKGYRDRERLICRWRSLVLTQLFFYWQSCFQLQILGKIVSGMQ